MVYSFWSALLGNSLTILGVTTPERPYATPTVRPLFFRAHCTSFNIHSALLTFFTLFHSYCRKPSINTADGSCMFSMLFKVKKNGINYNESWKVKNTFLIADFVNFLTKGVISVHN